MIFLRRCGGHAGRNSNPRRPDARLRRDASLAGCNAAMWRPLFPSSPSTQGEARGKSSYFRLTVMPFKERTLILTLGTGRRDKANTNRNYTPFAQLRQTAGLTTHSHLDLVGRNHGKQTGYPDRWLSTSSPSTRTSRPNRSTTPCSRFSGASGFIRWCPITIRSVPRNGLLWRSRWIRARRQQQMHGLFHQRLGHVHVQHNAVVFAARGDRRYLALGRVGPRRV